MSKHTTRAPPARRQPRQPRHIPRPATGGSTSMAADAAPEAPAFIEPAKRQGMIAEADGSRAKASDVDPGYEVDAGLAALKDVEHPLPLPSSAPFADG